MLPPLTYGSRTSRLFTERLDKGHGKGITDAEKRVLACWVDLCVPFCGDYSEANAWDEKDFKRWEYFTSKRRRFMTSSEAAAEGMAENTARTTLVAGGN